jgi:hypothetical protein
VRDRWRVPGRLVHDDAASIVAREYATLLSVGQLS